MAKMVCFISCRKYQFILNHVFIQGAAARQNPDEAVPDPPSYTAATKLPTYDEAERTKGELLLA